MIPKNVLGQISVVNCLRNVKCLRTVWWCKRPFFFPKPCCPAGDRVCPWTLLRFHYKSVSKWTWLTFITWRQIYFVVSPPVATASNSPHGSWAAWHADKEVAAILFTLLFPSWGQHSSLNCMFHLPHTETQVYTHCHPSRVAMPLPCFPLWWHPGIFPLTCTGTGQGTQWKSLPL